MAEPGDGSIVVWYTNKHRTEACAVWQRCDYYAEGEGDRATWHLAGNRVYDGDWYTWPDLLEHMDGFDVVGPVLLVPAEDGCE
jgi:hypothetical protein